MERKSSIDFQEVRERSNLLSLASEAGLAPRRIGPEIYQVSCPFHDERTPSCTLYPDQHYYCFGCGASGDAVSWLVQTRDMSIKEAVAAIMGTDERMRSPLIPRRSEPRRPVRPVQAPDPIPLVEIMEWHWELIKNRAAVEWLCRHRCLDEEIVELAHLGLHRGRITIPVFDLLSQKWIDVRHYRPGGHPKILPHSAGRLAAPYIVSDKHLIVSDVIVVCEGEMDALASISAGVPTVTNTCGAKSALKVWTAYANLLQHEKIVVCMDSDDEGAVAAGQLAEVFGNRMTPVFLPEKDITDSIRARGAAWFRDFIQETLQ